VRIQGTFKTVSGFVERAVTDGARVVTGGCSAPDAGKLFYRPTILTHVRPEMELAREEIFGPVLSVLTFDTEEEAVELANSTEYGLGAGVWTTDVRRAPPAIHSHWVSSASSGLRDRTDLNVIDQPVRHPGLLGSDHINQPAATGHVRQSPDGRRAAEAAAPLAYQRDEYDWAGQAT
jgi:hypothetical protein